MKNEEFDQMVNQFRWDQDDLIATKGHDYTIASPDRLFNFKFVGDLLGLRPEQVAAVYWLKHVMAILTHLKTGKLESSEPIEGRFLDEANYALLLQACMKEDKPPSTTAEIPNIYGHKVGCACDRCLFIRGKHEVSS